MKSIAASMPGTLLNSGGLGAPPAATGPGAPPARRRSSRPRGPRTAGGGPPGPGGPGAPRGAGARLGRRRGGGRLPPDDGHPDRAVREPLAGIPLAQEAEDRVEEREQVPEELGHVPCRGLAEGERSPHGADLEVEHVLPEGPVGAAPRRRSRTGRTRRRRRPRGRRFRTPPRKGRGRSTSA